MNIDENVLIEKENPHKESSISKITDIICATCILLWVSLIFGLPLISLVFIALKLFAVITWSWVIVLIPVILLCFEVIAGYIVIAILASQSIY